MASVMLATADNDFGLVSSRTAKSRAQKLANEEGKTVTLRHVVTDRVLGRVKPAKKARRKPGCTVRALSRPSKIGLAH